MIGEVFAKAWRHSFFKNAFYLMVSTVAVAGLGFVFWVVVAHRYSPDAVGLATALLSLSGLLSLLGLAGFDTTLVRFLPGSKHKSTFINTGVVVVAAVSGGLAAGTALLLPLFLPSLLILHDSAAWAGFVFFTVTTALTTLVNAVFLAHKQARFVLLLNVVLGGTKVVLPLVTSEGSAMAIFSLAGTAQLAGLVFGMVVLRKKFKHTVRPQVDLGLLKLVKKYSLAVYAASVLNLLPPTILPLLVAQSLGTAQSAFYYMAFTIASVLYTIGYAAMQSVFAEASHNQSALPALIRKAVFIVAGLLVPAALLTVLASPWLMGLFGPEYAAKSGPLLQLFAVSAVPVAAYSALGAIFKVRHNLRAAVAMNLAYAVAILITSTAMLTAAGLGAVGWAWLMGNLVACAIGALFLYNKRGGRNGTVTSSGRRR